MCIQHFLTFIMQEWIFFSGKKSDPIWLEAWESLSFELCRCWWFVTIVAIKYFIQDDLFPLPKHQATLTTRVYCPLKHPPRLIQLEIFSAFSPSGFKENTGAPTNIWRVWKHHKTCHVCWERPRWRLPGWQRDASYILLPTLRYSTYIIVYK